MKKIDTDKQREEPDGSEHKGVPVDASSKFLIDVFERSVEKLEPADRASVLARHEKLVRSFALLSEKIGEILSSEEGHLLMQQELQNRERSKK